MITIVTGTPGTGKTAYVVSELEKITDRNIFVDGIPDLILPHEVAPPVTDWVSVDQDESGATSHKWNIPANSIVIIDEAQRSFRPRPTGSKVPDYVAAMETHRHAGLDFWFITQHPGLIDVNIRRLVGRHIHIRNTPIGRRLHESTQVFDPENRSERESTVTRPYTLPKQVFGKYRSAEIHTKNKKRLPLSFYAVILAVCGFIGISYFGYQSIKSKVQPETAKAAPSSEQTVPAPAQSGQVASIQPADLLVEFDPRIKGRPETAPAYDALRQVKNMPVVAGCIQTPTRCTCQTQTGTDAGLDRSQCLAWIKNPPFDPYRDQATKVEPLAGEARPAAPDGQGRTASSGQVNEGETRSPMPSPPESRTT